MTKIIVEQLKQAVADVEEADVPEDLRPVAFASAFWAFKSPAGPAAAVQTPAPPQPPESLTPSGTPISNHDRAGLIAKKLGVSVDDVEFVYELEGNDGDLGLRLPPASLDSKLRDAVEQIVYLVAAGRQACGLDERTPTKSIKAVCLDRGKVSSNFGRIVDGLHGDGVSVAGSGHARSVRVNAVGFEKATNLTKQFVESGA